MNPSIRRWSILLALAVAVPAAAALAAPVVPPVPAPAAEAPAIRWEPYTVEHPDGQEEAAEVGRFTVPERHGRAGGRELELAFIRLRSTSPTPGPPIVYLDGGPGGSGASLVAIPELAPLVAGLRRVGDLLLLAQRGTPYASPPLACASEGPLPADALTTAERLGELTLPRFARCAAELRAAGHDLAAYDTEESADDVEALRRALGVERLSLLGFSYGTHLGLAILRRHGDGIHRAVLAGVEGPEDTWKLPLGHDAQLQAIATLAATDPEVGDAYPDLVASLRTLLARVREAPIAVEIGEGEARRRVLVGEAGIQYLLLRDLADTHDTPWIPAFVIETLAGRHDELRRLVARRLPGIEGGIRMMGVAMDCASAASPERLATIRAQQADSIFGRMLDAPFPEVCDAIGVAPLPASFREPVKSDVPTLFVSGTLDARTPPEQAESVRRGFSRAAHLVVTHAGHESTLPHPEVQRLVVDFLAGLPVADHTIAAPRPEILPPRLP